MSSPDGAATSKMTREETKLVAAVERFQKLEEDRQRERERTSKGKEEVRKRNHAAAVHEATCAPKQQRQSRGARAKAAVENSSAAEQSCNADAPGRAGRDGLIGRSVAKFFPAQARSCSGTVRHYHSATDTYTILFEDSSSETMPESDLQRILTPAPATAKAAKGQPQRRKSFCQHQRQRSRCKECGGADICQHQRIRSTCKECGGSGICPHQRRRSTCKECGGASICQHQRIRSRCKECREEADGSMPDGLEEL